MSYVRFHAVVPVLRIFDVPKADDFYLDYLGFKLDWKHNDPGNASTPSYRQISRSGLILHLSEHHGDGSPGINLRIPMTGIFAYYHELEGKDYKFMKPAVEKSEVSGEKELAVMDPFGNRITFCERDD